MQPNLPPEDSHTEEKKQEMKNSIGRAIIVALAVLLQVGWLVGLFTKLAAYSTLLNTITMVAAVLVALSVYGSHMNAAYRISWIVLILVFPLLGVPIYLAFGRESSTALMRRRYARVDSTLQDVLPEDAAVWEALNAQDDDLALQARYLQRQGFPLFRNTDVDFYGDTVEALEAQKQALRSAEHFIFMEYHAIEDAAAWRGIEEILREKAAAGVEVRVFYDDMGSIGFISKPFAKRLQREGIQCRVFNPLLPVLNVFMNNRDHRKITVVDGRVGFTGGYNLADEYFNYTHPYGEWKDSGLRLTGDAVHSLTRIFLQMWNATQPTPEDPTPYLPKVAYQAQQQGFVLPYSDTPLDEECVGENVYLNLVNSARRYVYLATPYLILDDEMQAALMLAAKNGVDVRLVTPGIPDKKLVFRVTRSYYARLARAGVRIFEFSPGFVHAKQAVADDRVAVCGTINLDFRSLYLHFENGCWYCGCPAVQKMRADFDALFPRCAEVTEQYANRRSLALRGGDLFLRLFSPLM